MFAAPAEPELKTAAPEEISDSFVVSLEEFSGPFDVLLSLIAKHRLDVTALALHQVTDDFVAYIKARGDEWTLDEATEFLVIAATLLDLKAARLIPGGEVEDEEDIAVLEARDLLLARLLQYRAFKEMSADFKYRLATAGRQHPRAAGLDDKFAKLLPEVELGMGPDDFANLAARALEPKLPDVISVAHIHAARVSVREQAAIIVERLRRVGQASFRTLTRDCDTTLLVVARFLALLEIYRDGLVTFDQATPLGELYVRWIGDDEVNIDAMREIDEFDSTQVQDFRTQLGDVDISEPLVDKTGEQPNE
jgi:segregation and condensation protein A